MSVRLLTTSTLLLVLAGTAFADCKQEIAGLKGAVTEAETGARTNAAGMPATTHQEDVLKGKQGDATGASGGDVAASPHQREALAKTDNGQQEPATLIAQADHMAAAGDEQGCMQKVSEVKDLLGLK